MRSRDAQRPAGTGTSGVAASSWAPSQPRHSSPSVSGLLRPRTPSKRTLRDTGGFRPEAVHILCARLARGQGRFELAREHLELGARASDEPQSKAAYAALVAELALWEGRFDDALGVVDRVLQDKEPSDLLIREPHLCALGLRAVVERVRQAAVRRDDAVIGFPEQRTRAARARTPLGAGAAAVSPEADGWAAGAESEHTRVEGSSSPERWQAAAAIWEQLERPYLAAYCRWRLVEALLAAGAPRTDAIRQAREAHRTARHLAAAPLLHELEQLAQRARLDLAGADPSALPDDGDALGLTAREREVLLLLARGYTNREIASELTISVKTASVHVHAYPAEARRHEPARGGRDRTPLDRLGERTADLIVATDRTGGTSAVG